MAQYRPVYKTGFHTFTISKIKTNNASEFSLLHLESFLDFFLPPWKGGFLFIAVQDKTLLVKKYKIFLASCYFKSFVPQKEKLYLVLLLRLLQWICSIWNSLIELQFGKFYFESVPQKADSYVTQTNKVWTRRRLSR